MQMITAQEAAAQGSTPSLFYSIAKSNPRLAGEARKRARELAGLLGMPVRGAARTGANDNRKKRRAA